MIVSKLLCDDEVNFMQSAFMKRFMFGVNLWCDIKGEKRVAFLGERMLCRVLTRRGFDGNKVDNEQRWG
jgi:hypothetical protein